MLMSENPHPILMKNYSLRHLFLAGLFYTFTCSPEWVFNQVSVISIQYRILLLLVLDIVPYSLLVEPHRTNVIPSCPKMMPSEIPSQTAVFLEQDHCALPFQVPNNRAYSIFRGYRQTYVDVIRTCRASDYLHLLVLTQLSQYLPDIFPQCAINDFSPILRNPNYMIFALPCCV